MANVITLKKEESIKQLRAKLQAAQKNNNGIVAKEYTGTISLKEDPVKYQKQVRDEWN